MSKTVIVQKINYCNTCLKITELSLILPLVLAIN